jgi:hypothetical protein
MIAQALIPAVATLGTEFYVGHRLGVPPKTLAKILLSGLAASIVVGMIVIAVTPSPTRVAL